MNYSQHIIFRVLAILVFLAGGVGFGVWKNWHDRYVWPGKPVSSMQDLPVADRSQWPVPPVAWTIESVEMEVATLDGLQQRLLSYHVNSIGMKLVRLSPGMFWMGLTPGQMQRLRFKSETGHQVTLTKPYFMGAMEVTNKQFEMFDPEHVRRRPVYQQGQSGDLHPVEPVTWREAQLFCRWLSEKEGRHYRLPTEAEWEYGCRAGTRTRTYWGDNVWDRNMANVGGLKKDKESWLEDGWVHSSPVGTYPPNAWGFYDMIGNSWEWVADWFTPFTAEPRTDPFIAVPTGRYRVAKGTGWSTRTRHITACSRDGNNPADLHDIRGFRVVCVIEPSTVEQP
jgi:sulfatase modifying factor 1